MDTPAPQIVWEQSDRLLSGTILAIRGVGLPEEDELRSVVSMTFHMSAESVQIGEDGSATATVLLGPQEALGVSSWLRQASTAADEVGPPLYGWESADE